ncbi:hypothetical protein HHI36_011216 [Cryptolaemus montrouzieri]|uniref:Actin-related protein 10 n=1 Tax=Cryptolaemus montrouzieri TaxID=559131 RepID=A0ABD2ML01_9CUCU
MPLYEVEKSVIVLDIGTSFTKFGFTSEPAPRSIYRTQVKSKGQIRELWDYRDAQDLYDMLVDFFHDIYFKYALNSPKDKPIVIVESLLCPIIFRETLAKVLYKHYGVSSILLLSSHLVSLAPLAIDTALVLDVGYKEAVCIPVCYGMPMIHAWQALNLGSQTIHKHLQMLLNEKNSGAQNLSEMTLEDIKVRCCFVTKKSRAQQLQTLKPQIEMCPEIKYPVKGSTTISVCGTTREKAYEILFDEDADHLCLPTMILDALMKVNIDLKHQLAENIVLIGGTTMAMGFKSRLKEELLCHSKEERYKKLNIKCFKFHTSPSKENYAAWLGGAIYGSTDCLNTKAIQRRNILKKRNYLIGRI